MNESSTAKRQRVTWSPEERVDWVRMFEKSGKAVSEFCRENGLPESTFALWRKQLRGPETGGEAGALVQIPTIPLESTAPIVPPAASAAVRVRLPCGVELEVAAGTDVQWFAGIVRALQPGA
jgi:transposase-like protein